MRSRASIQIHRGTSSAAYDWMAFNYHTRSNLSSFVLLPFCCAMIAQPRGNRTSYCLTCLQCEGQATQNDCRTKVLQVVCKSAHSVLQFANLFGTWKFTENILDDVRVLWIAQYKSLFMVSKKRCLVRTDPRMLGLSSTRSRFFISLAFGYPTRGDVASMQQKSMRNPDSGFVISTLLSLRPRKYDFRHANYRPRKQTNKTSSLL